VTARRLVTQGGLSGDQFDNLYKYYREVYAEVRRVRTASLGIAELSRHSAHPSALGGVHIAQLTVDDIERYEQTYRGSAEEERELKELYTRFSGNMKQCVAWARVLRFAVGPPVLRRLLACTEYLSGCAARARSWTRTASWSCCSAASPLVRLLLSPRG
jgi:hypothetical protein